ncbi:uncharacterized protein LOC117472210 [Trematomus bernacchii]|uniref:uncharacterized protein LOC117472210 n=1 Tax=Trematomus bernacchii TaxID=40690 RepID=UPI00146E59C6|nr:uncharacterized protein LOC117472210 [Trematomus bernacchii]
MRLLEELEELEDLRLHNWKEMIKNNHVTEASQSMRDTADALDQMCRTLRTQFDDMKTMMANRQREHQERLKKERQEKEWFPRGRQEHRNLKMALSFLIIFLFLFQGSIFCKTDKDMSLSSERSIQGKETESHMGLRHEEERQGHQTERTGSELEKGSEWTGSESIQRETPFVRATLLNVNSMNKKTSNISEFITNWTSFSQLRRF